jgi:hypothetical protein
MFSHLAAPICNCNIPTFASVIPVFFHQSLFSHQSSNPFRPGKFRSTSFPSSWWTPFHNFFWQSSLFILWTCPYHRSCFVLISSKRDLVTFIFIPPWKLTICQDSLRCKQGASIIHCEVAMQKLDWSVEIRVSENIGHTFSRLYACKSEWLLYVPFALTQKYFTVFPRSAFLCLMWFFTINRRYFPELNLRIFFIGYEVCVLRGVNWIFADLKSKGGGGPGVA